MNANLNQLDPSKEDSYWQSQFDKEHYYTPGASFDDYRGAYRTGCEGYYSHLGNAYSDVEAQLRQEWENARGPSRLGWEQARHAVRAAWDRMHAHDAGRA
jgi:hypothetical protein